MLSFVQHLICYTSLYPFVKVFITSANGICRVFSPVSPYGGVLRLLQSHAILWAFSFQTITYIFKTLKVYIVVLASLCNSISLHVYHIHTISNRISVTKLSPVLQHIPLSSPKFITMSFSRVFVQLQNPSHNTSYHVVQSLLFRVFHFQLLCHLLYQSSILWLGLYFSISGFHHLEDLLFPPVKNTLSHLDMLISSSFNAIKMMSIYSPSNSIMHFTSYPCSFIIALPPKLIVYYCNN